MITLICFLVTELAIAIQVWRALDRDQQADREYFRHLRYWSYFSFQAFERRVGR